jgi:hypothetical protein
MTFQHGDNWRCDETCDHPTRSPYSPDPTTATGQRELVAQWMIRHGYSTGHGDTLTDLLEELATQLPRSPDSPDPLWDDIYGEDGTARLLPGPPEVMSEADRRIASIAPRSSDSVRTPDLDVPERLCPHGTRWNYTCDECEKVVEWYAAVNDLYLVTHLHESDDCAECLAALHPASPQEGTE